MILLIDNYDSFTYNIYQYFGMLGAKVKVKRNDAITLREIQRLKPKRILLSPGPGYPHNAGICLRLVQEFAGKIPILGICLGHQTIAQAFGAKIVKAPKLMHGKTSAIIHQQIGLYQSIPTPLNVTRYHSLVVAPETLPKVFKVTATTADGTIMGISHKHFPLEGVQYHPESYMTEHGMKIFANFLKI